MAYSLYYQAQVKPETCWLFTGILRSYEHLVFDRTLDVAQSVFEFFVPPLNEAEFVELMRVLEKKGLVCDLTRLPNRLSQS